MRAVLPWLDEILAVPMRQSIATKFPAVERSVEKAVELGSAWESLVEEEGHDCKMCRRFNS
jgi:hypothetical protein